MKKENIQIKSQCEHIWAFDYKIKFEYPNSYIKGQLQEKIERYKFEILKICGKCNQLDYNFAKEEKIRYQSRKLLYSLTETQKKAHITRLEYSIEYNKIS